MISLKKKLLLSIFFVFCCSLGTTWGQGSSGVEEGKQIVEDWINGNEEMLIAVSDQLWRNAELSFQEHKTMEIMIRALEQGGFLIEKGVAQMPTAFVATYGSGKPVIGLLAEMDALPALSQDTVPYPKPLVEGGVGHGCQHNLVAASSIGAALALKNVLDRLKISGTIKVFGAPAEEVFFGKIYMIKAGLFDGVDVCLSWHSDRVTNARHNASIAINTVRTRFYKKGRSNPLKYFKNFDRNIDFLGQILPEGQSISDAAILKGGARPGLSPEVIEAWYSLRTFDRKSVDALFQRFERIAEFESEVMGSRVEVELVNGVYPRLPNEALVKMLDRNLRLHWPPQFTAQEKEFARKLQEEYQKENPDFSAPAPLHDEILEPPIQTPKPAGNDNGDVSWVVPMAAISGGSRAMHLPAHTWQSTAAGGMGIGHKVMIMMTKTIAGTALELIMQPAELKAVRDEFEEKTRGFTDKPYVPDKPPIEFYKELNKVFNAE